MVLSLQEDVGRYRPLKDVSIGGIVVVKNVSGEPCQIVEPVAVKKSGDKVRDLQGDKMNGTVGFVNCFLRVPALYLPCCLLLYRQCKQEKL